VTAAAWVDGSAIAAAEVDERLIGLRSRDQAGALPAADSREGRQLRRWVAQVAVVERVCEREVAARGEGSARGGGLGDLTRADAAALGSIVAAAWTNNPAVPRAADLVTRDVSVAPGRLRRAAALSATDDGGTVWTADALIASARMEAFARWLARATHERVRLEEGFEHPGDATQPDNLHEH
jgi:[acyl-carrier-protein] S-malonyltransferase